MNSIIFILCFMFVLQTQGMRNFYDIPISSKILEKHEETIPLIPSVPPENTVASTGSEHLSVEEVEHRMKLLCEDR
jgi:hypothetical protein